MIDVSVIIPAYNASKDINFCLQSLADQEYKNYEVIIINDGSTDKTEEIVKLWSEKDDRIILENNTSKGVSSARNIGISIAKGKYILFLDADDQVSPLYVKKLVSLIKANNCECVSVAYTVNIKELKRSDEGTECKCFDGNTVFQLLTDNKYQSGGYVWNKIYLTSIIKKNHVRFDENISSGEDILFNYNYFNYVKKFVFCEDKLYYYKLSSGSTINRLDNSRWFDLVQVYTIIMSSKIDENVIDAFRFNFAVLILEGMYRFKYCKISKFTYNDLMIMKMKYSKLSIKYSLKQNLKLLIFRLFPNIVMKYRRRAIKEVL